MESGPLEEIKEVRRLAMAEKTIGMEIFKGDFMKFGSLVFGGSLPLFSS